MCVCVCVCVCMLYHSNELFLSSLFNMWSCQRRPRPARDRIFTFASPIRYSLHSPLRFMPASPSPLSLTGCITDIAHYCSSPSSLPSRHLHPRPPPFLIPLSFCHRAIPIALRSFSFPSVSPSAPGRSITSSRRAPSAPVRHYSDNLSTFPCRCATPAPHHPPRPPFPDGRTRARSPARCGRPLARTGCLASASPRSTAVRFCLHATRPLAAPRPPSLTPPIPLFPQVPAATFSAPPSCGRSRRTPTAWAPVLASTLVCNRTASAMSQWRRPSHPSHPPLCDRHCGALHLPLRHGGAEAALPAGRLLGRLHCRHCHDRAGGRQRPSRWERGWRLLCLGGSALDVSSHQPTLSFSLSLF